MVPKEIIPEEPHYVDPDDFGDNDWMYPVTEFEKKALKLTGRVHFKSEAQAKRLRAIESRSTRAAAQSIHKNISNRYSSGVPRRTNRGLSSYWTH